MAQLKGNDTINGKEGKATAIVNGNVVDLFYLRNLQADVEKKKETVNAVGRRGESHKTGGWSGTGTMTIYYIAPIFREMIMNYIKNGVDTYFTLNVTNDDPASSVGKQTTALYDCNIDGSVMAMLDAETISLEEEVAFTFEDVDFLDMFGNPVV